MPFNRESPIKRAKISSLGGKAAQASGRAHSFSSEKAREAVNKRWQNQRLREQKEADEQANTNPR